MSRFPDDFLWGVSTASYQIEGAVGEDGRGTSIWDTFSHTPGRVANGDTGDVACDHYHRYREDIALMADLGVDAYRFSTAWPRIQPTGRGSLNRAGLDFYERLVDALLAAGIQPWLCLYHWDLPQALEDRGGWQSRDTVHRFVEYAFHVYARLGDRVRHVIPFNEPAVFSILGYGEGIHAPGVRSRKALWRAIHHVNLAHGAAVQMLRGEDQNLSIGAINALNPLKAASDAEADIIAAEYADALNNRANTDPQFLGRYPAPLASEFAALIEPDDMATIHQPLDFFGLNHYNRSFIRHDPGARFGYVFEPPAPGKPTTDMGWEISPAGFREQLLDIHHRYGPLPIYITENGAGYDEAPGVDGIVDDTRRIGYLRGYLAAMAEAMAEGVDVRGYFVWSLLDNFEWSLGYAKRFGLVHVDYASLARRPKRSFGFYQAVMAGHRLP